MTTKKLTLSIEPSTISKARRVSRQRNTSISAMFADYIALLDESPAARPVLPPLTQRARKLADGTAALPDDWDYRSELADIISDQYDTP